LRQSRQKAVRHDHTSGSCCRCVPDASGMSSLQLPANNLACCASSLGNRQHPFEAQQDLQQQHHSVSCLLQEMQSVMLLLHVLTLLRAPVAACSQFCWPLQGFRQACFHKRAECPPAIEVSTFDTSLPLASSCKGGMASNTAFFQLT
jgi:hypothetical protein